MDVLEGVGPLLAGEVGFVAARKVGELERPHFHEHMDINWHDSASLPLYGGKSTLWEAPVPKHSVYN